MRFWYLLEAILVGLLFGLLGYCAVNHIPADFYTSAGWGNFPLVFLFWAVIAWLSKHWVSRTLAYASPLLGYVVAHQYLSHINIVALADIVGIILIGIIVVVLQLRPSHQNSSQPRLN